MKKTPGTIYTNLLGSVMTICLIAVPVAFGSDSERHQLVDGTDIYLGVIPAQMAAHHPDAHGSRPGKRHVYHVIIALFDSETGKRITDAKVQATVTDHALTETHKMLKPMHMDDAISYGHFFRMDAPGRYSIKLEIQRPGTSRPVRADFMYRRPQD